MHHRAMVMLGLFGAFAVFLVVGILLINALSLSTLGFTFIGLSVLIILGAVVYTVMGFIQPAWTKRVAQNGKPATATVIENNAMTGIGGYQGEDVWLELPVKVQPSDAPPFDAKMKCKLSQTFLLKAGSQVQVRYDPADKSKVILTSDPLKDLVASRKQ